MSATVTEEKSVEKVNVLNNTPTTPEQAEKYEAYLDRNFVRVDSAGKVINVTNPRGTGFKPSQDEFIYQVISGHMRYFGHGNEADGVMRFNVQKCFKNKTQKVFVKDANGNKKERTVPMPVTSHVQNNNEGALQIWTLVDADATFPIDCADFDRQFKAI